MPLIDLIKLLPDEQYVEITIADYSFKFDDKVSNLNFSDCDGLFITSCYSYVDCEYNTDYIHIETKRMEGDKNEQYQIK